jgi:hypothetical protein
MRCHFCTRGIEVFDSQAGDRRPWGDVGSKGASQLI